MPDINELTKQLSDLTSKNAYAKASRVSSRALWVTLFGCGTALWALTNTESHEVAAVCVAALTVMVSVYTHGKLRETAITNAAKGGDDAGSS